VPPLLGAALLLLLLLHLLVLLLLLRVCLAAGGLLGALVCHWHLLPQLQQLPGWAPTHVEPAAAAAAADSEGH
jgi:hypothetical protein